MKTVMPRNMATIYLNESNGPYQRKIVKDCAYFYKNGIEVFNCNAVFASLHFYIVNTH